MKWNVYHQDSYEISTAGLIFFKKERSTVSTAVAKAGDQSSYIHL